MIIINNMNYKINIFAEHLYMTYFIFICLYSGEVGHLLYMVFETQATSFSFVYSLDVI